MENLKLERLKKEDFHDTLNLLNTVFSAHNGKEMDFATMFPRIFVAEDKTMGWHIGAKIDGKLCGVAASYPLTYRVGGTDLSLSAGGNVAVDASVRGKGIMQSILNQFDKEDREDGFDICYLHGDRFRYRNFGYERCGVEYSFTLTRQMFGKDAPKRDFEYVDLRCAKEEFIREVFDFYNKQSVCLIRDYADFMPSLKTKGRLPLAVLSEGKEIIAYFTVGDDGCIGEISIKDEALFSDVIKGYMSKNDVSKLFLSMPSYDPLTNQALKVAERYHVMQPGNFKILNFRRVVESFMREKSLHETLSDGKITIDSEVLGAWSIEKKGDKISVEQYDGEAQYVLPGYTVYPFLFGPLAPKQFSKEYDDELLNAWLPIPLYCPYLT